MVTLVIGGSSSGKSAFAEQVLSGKTDVKYRYYLATMKVYDEEGRKKVERHKKLRRGKGFLTLEYPTDIGRAAEKMDWESAVLIECISNLTANEMFGATLHEAKEVEEKVLDGICRIRDKVKHLVIVTNNVFEDGIRYDHGTTEYLKALAKINQRLASIALSDEVVEVVAGIPLPVKRGQDRG